MLNSYKESQKNDKYPNFMLILPTFRSKILFLLLKMSHFVNPDLPYRIVYALYHHEYFHYLVGAYIVQLLENEQYSFTYQSLNPENIDKFSANIDENDRKLVQICKELQIGSLVKRFGGELKKQEDFFLKKFSAPNSTLPTVAHDFIQKQLVKIFPLLENKEIFEMGNDGYPAFRKINHSKEKATAIFHFQREENRVLYYVTLKLRQEKLFLTHKKAIILTNQPAWILMKGELFTFNNDIEGKKMQPFLTKFNIEIPKAKELEYFEKFIGQVLEKYEVRPKGFEIYDINTIPFFQLEVKYAENAGFSFEKKVIYGNFSWEFLEDKQELPLKVFFENKTPFTFYRIHRKMAAENLRKKFLAEIAPNKESFLAWENIPKDKGLNWLAVHAVALAEMDFTIVQSSKDFQFNLVAPTLDINTKTDGDWFDIQAIVTIGKYKIPFIQFKNHILRHQKEYALPDGTYAILPETWFTNYRHLMEVAKNEGHIIRIRNYQIPLLPVEEKTSKAANLLPFEEIPPLATPQNLKAALRHYQQKGYEWLSYMKEHKAGVILADDMGLGKTLQTIALLLKEKEIGIKTPSLIVMPTSLVFNWASELRKFAPELRTTTHIGTNRSKTPSAFAFFDVILTTYGTMRMDIDMLKTFPFHYVILDESQSIKNPEAKISQAVKLLISQYRLSLTGTPLENSVTDIWSQMAFLNPGLLGNEAFFKQFYQIPIEKERSSKQAAQLRSIIQPYILRRKKQEVATDLPPKIENIHYCEMTEKQQELYERTRDTYRNYLLELIQEGTLRKNKLNILAGLQKIRQIAIHPRMIDDTISIDESGKYAEVREKLAEILATDSKVLIFSQFVRMLSIFESDLKQNATPYLYLDGSTPAPERKKNVEAFQSDPNIKVFLISLKAGGVGLNLTAADYVFILDPWWNPAVEQQAIDRAHRIGQTKSVFYYKFITKNSIEEKILRLQQSKQELSDALIGKEHDFYEQLDAAQLMEMLE